MRWSQIRRSAYLQDEVKVQRSKCIMGLLFLSFFWCIPMLTLLMYTRASPVAQMVKSLPTMQETRVQSLGQEDLVEKGMASHSSILAWRIHGQERGRLQSTASGRVEHDWDTHTWYMYVHACCLQRGGLWTPFALGNSLATRETGSYGFKEITYVWC